jgi:hypothetical protein
LQHYYCHNIGSAPTLGPIFIVALALLGVLLLLVPLEANVELALFDMCGPMVLLRHDISRTNGATTVACGAGAVQGDCAASAAQVRRALVLHLVKVQLGRLPSTVT